MGAWSEDNFGNDDACDWVLGLARSKGLSTLLEPILVVMSEEGLLEASVCSEALAASEIIAAAVSGDESGLPNEARIWLNQKQGFIFGRCQWTFTLTHFRPIKLTHPQFIY